MASKIAYRIQVPIERRLPSLNGIAELLLVVCGEHVGRTRGVLAWDHFKILNVKHYRLRLRSIMPIKNPPVSVPRRLSHRTHA